MKRLLLSTMVSAAAWAAPKGGVLPMEEFLKQVRQANEGVRASAMVSQSALLRSGEAGMMWWPSLFSNVGGAIDKRQTTNPTFFGTSNDAFKAEAGVSQLTPWGLSGRLYYSVANYNTYEAPLLPIPRYWTASPVLELQQSFWRNFLGGETKAAFEAVEAKALLAHHTESFKLQHQLIEAEVAYWRLALARRVLGIQNDSLKRAQRMQEWAARRARLNLGDRADSLQAEAGLRQRQIELQAAIDDERSARLAFNAARGRAGDDVPELLPEAKSEALLKLPLPARGKTRADVRAAEQGMRLAAAEADMGREKNKGSLDFSISTSLNALDPVSATSAMGNSFSTSHPYVVMGLKFSMPLDFAQLSRDREAYAAERLGAELQYKRKVFEQERDWADLTQKLDESRRRLSLAAELVELQKEKLSHERTRLERGRSTTYQVVLFEQDYALAELQAVKLQSDILGLLAQLKLFSPAQADSDSATGESK